MRDGEVFRNPFGMQLGAGTPQHWKATDRAGVLARHRARIEADALMVEHANHWQRSGELITPTQLHPGDIGALRAAVSGNTTHARTSILDLYAGLQPLPANDPQFAAMIESIAPPALGRIDKLYSATVFYLPAADAEPLLSTFRPDPTIVAGVKLPPGANLVMLSHPMLFVAGSGWWDPAAAEAFAGVDQDIKENWGIGDQPFEIGDFYTSGGALVGVLLFADDDGQLTNDVAWIVSHLVDPDAGTLSAPTLEVGLLTEAGFAPIAENLACALAFGDWVTPGAEPGTPPDVSTRAGRRAWSTSSTMRKARRGDFTSVNVIDMHRRSRRRRPELDEQSSRTVAAHLRRPHWRWAWYGPKDTPDTREQRPVWIAATIVAGGASADDRQRVYRLPEPPSPSEWEGFRNDRPDQRGD